MDDMLDPYGDRVMKNVPMIARHPLTKAGGDLWKTTRTYSILMPYSRSPNT